MFASRGAQTGARKAVLRWSCMALLALGVFVADSTPARAQGLAGLGLGGLPGQILPPNPLNSAQTISPGFDDCPAGEASCPARVILEMYERWRPLNASCDHRAVFALTYLRTTEEFARTIKANPGFFEDGAWVNHEDAVFAQLYFRAYDAREAGAAIPVAWRVAFDSAASPNVTGIGDLFLGMNAHINRDLSYTLAAVGLLKPGGGSRKTDHDRVNGFLANVADPLQAELAARYDPLFATTDPPGVLDETLILEAVRGFREQAWRNAEPFVNAPNDGARSLVAASIEAQSNLYAQSILAAGTLPGYGPSRDAYCRSRLRPSFEVNLLDSHLKPVVRRGELWLNVVTDGPARVTLDAEVLRRSTKKAKPGAAEAAKKKGKKKKKQSLQVAKPADFKTAKAGKHGVELKLTKRGERLLRKRRSARVVVTLRAPRGLSASDQDRLTRRARGSKRR